MSDREGTFYVRELFFFAIQDCLSFNQLLFWYLALSVYLLVMKCEVYFCFFFVLQSMKAAFIHKILLKIILLLLDIFLNKRKHLFKYYFTSGIDYEYVGPFFASYNFLVI